MNGEREGSSNPSIGRLERVVWGVAFVAVAAFNFYSLVRFPQPVVDEGWLGSRAWALSQTGVAFGELDRGILDHYLGYWTYFPLVTTAIQAIPYRLFGLSLFSARLSSYVFGLILLGAVFVVTRRLATTRAAGFAVVLVGLSPAFLISGHWARPDVIVAAAGYASIALYLGAKSTGFPTRMLIAGALIGLAFEAHPNAILFGATVVVLFVLDERAHVVRSSRFWAFLTGASIGPILDLALHVFPYPQTFFAITNLEYGASKTPPMLQLAPDVWLRSIGDTLTLLWQFGTFWTPAALIGLWWIASQKNERNWKLLAIAIAPVVAFAALLPAAPPYYAIEIDLGFYLLVAVFLDRLWGRPLPREAVSGWLQRLSAVLLVAIAGLGLVVGLAVNVNAAATDREGAYLQAISLIQSTVPKGAAILGPETYWFGLADHRYVAWENLTYYPTMSPGKSLADAFCYLHPDYFIYDQQISRFVANSDVGLDAIGRHVRISQTELTRFLAQNAQLVAFTDTDWYGHVQIYRLNLSCP